MGSIEVFSENYSEARDKFRRAAVKVGGIVTHYENANFIDAQGGLLSCDVACLGPLNARKKMVIISGTHGQEGYAGSAIQIQWLQKCEKLPADTAVVLIHAINPWGMENWSRTTEHNVDLNRNFIDHNAPAPENKLYAELYPFICPPECTEKSMEAVQGQIGQLMQQYGQVTVTNSIAGGQYDFSDGLNYGGDTPVWSNITLHKIIKNHIAGAQKVGVVDWHTGMGGYGEAFFMCFHDEGSLAYERACSWWGGDNLQQKMDNDFGEDPPEYVGLLFQGLERALGSAEVVGTVIEVGTRPIMDMMKALMIDRWIKYAAEENDKSIPQNKAFMRDAFYPADPVWRKNALLAGEKACTDMLKGIAAW